MQVKCFECAALIEADNADAIADAFVAHGRERHAWSYPEEALRNYGRNYGEATERLTGATERLSEIANVTLHPVTEERVDDWLELFDHDGFADDRIAPPVTASSLTRRRRRNYRSALGETHGRRWSGGCLPARPSGTSRTSRVAP